MDEIKGSNVTMNMLQNPKPESVVYEDERLYVCLAEYPITKGHTVVVWKKTAKDLHELNREEYEYLMDKVDAVRNALLQAYNIEKVYLIYMDEIQQVHWHLVPRYDEKGFNVFSHQPARMYEFPDTPLVRNALNRIT